MRALCTAQEEAWCACRRVRRGGACREGGSRVEGPRGGRWQTDPSWLLLRAAHCPCAPTPDGRQRPAQPVPHRHTRGSSSWAGACPGKSRGWCAYTVFRAFAITRSIELDPPPRALLASEASSHSTEQLPAGSREVDGEWRARSGQAADTHLRRHQLPARVRPALARGPLTSQHMRTCCSVCPGFPRVQDGSGIRGSSQLSELEDTAAAPQPACRLAAAGAAAAAALAPRQPLRTLVPARQAATPCHQPCWQRWTPLPTRRPACCACRGRTAPRPHC